MERTDKITNNTFLQNCDFIIHYLSLMKPRVMSLVVFTAVVGVLVAEIRISPILVFISIMTIALGSGGAAVINMWYDRDIDKVMLRTQNRPIVKGFIDSDDALIFGVLLSIFSVIILALATNIIAAALMAFTIIHYVFIYTVWLKRSSIHNIVIGGVAGAMPPMIGYVAASGSFDPLPIMLSLIIFLWTPPHSWALAIFKDRDYRIAKIPMLHIKHGIDSAKYQILLYSVLMYIATIAIYFLCNMSILYLFSVIILNICFSYYLYRLFISSDVIVEGKNLFVFSIKYLFIFFIVVLILN